MSKLRYVVYTNDVSRGRYETLDEAVIVAKTLGVTAPMTAAPVSIVDLHTGKTVTDWWKTA